MRKPDTNMPATVPRKDMKNCFIFKYVATMPTKIQFPPKLAKLSCKKLCV